MHTAKFFKLLKTLFVRVIFCIGLITVIGCSYLLFLYLQNPDAVNSSIKKQLVDDETVTSKVELPDKKGWLTFTVVPLNLALSEFKYIARIKTADGRKSVHILEIQPGGRPDVHVLFVVNTKNVPLLFFDHTSSHRRVIECINLDEHSIRTFDSREKMQKAYDFSEKSHICNLGWISESSLNLNN